MILLGIMEDLVLIKVITGAQGTKTQNGLGASEAPAGAGHFHAVFGQMTAGAFNHSRGDGKSLAKGMQGPLFL